MNKQPHTRRISGGRLILVIGLVLIGGLVVAGVLLRAVNPWALLLLPAFALAIGALLTWEGRP